MLSGRIWVEFGLIFAHFCRGSPILVEVLCPKRGNSLTRSRWQKEHVIYPLMIKHLLKKKPSSISQDCRGTMPRNHTCLAIQTACWMAHKWKHRSGNKPRQENRAKIALTRGLPLISYSYAIFVLIFRGVYFWNYVYYSETHLLASRLDCIACSQSALLLWARPPVRLGLSGRNCGKIPERLRKRSQSVSWNFPREYGWDAPNPRIQGIWGFQSVSRILSPPVRLGTLLFSEVVPERASQSRSWNSQQYWGYFWFWRMEWEQVQEVNLVSSMATRFASVELWLSIQNRRFVPGHFQDENGPLRLRMTEKGGWV